MECENPRGEEVKKASGNENENETEERQDEDAASLKL